MPVSNLWRSARSTYRLRKIKTFYTVSKKLSLFTESKLFVVSSSHIITAVDVLSKTYTKCSHTTQMFVGTFTTVASGENTLSVSPMGTDNYVSRTANHPRPQEKPRSTTTHGSLPNTRCDTRTGTKALVQHKTDSQQGSTRSTWPETNVFVLFLYTVWLVIGTML